MSADTVDIPAIPVSDEDVACSASGVVIGVQRATWGQIAPSLPEDLAQFVAPPITVTATDASSWPRRRFQNI